MSIFKKKPILITAAVLIAAAAIAVISHFSDGKPAEKAGEITYTAEKFFAKVFSPIANIGTAFSDKEKLISENEQLKAQLDELTKEVRGADEYIAENKRLKELLGIKEAMINKEVVAAEVISCDWDNFSETVTINRGSSDGLKKENAVVSSLGVIGRVTELGGDWARITTILSPKHSLGVRIVRTGDLAVAEGDVKLAKDKKLRLDYISGAEELVEGDIVETTGIGGVYPEGLTVGRVVEIKKDNSGAVFYAVVEPTADFERIYEVLVITGWERESVAPEYITDENTAGEADAGTGELTDEEIENAEG